ncbi:tyrosine decarboxylase MfnA [Streptomyces tirandamycinicus]|uniref:Tyrosine decarboxylase MfnA n=1 Tax=Streptomyces tirandamycinicus TaxID=2174846 RepID=A0A2S1SXK2_9ACTN|nr:MULTISPECIES: tyrosine decarboxylase MfnA [Streptomyces]AWI31111.1 tyrosine decarboxylase MfnA [Streptomyces tirandamycinicus]MCY0981883.1 tyrosine decarboxylase MfnA [Streptomyces tirandamycinicus]NNJ03669.1 tyrosine decarboxylase MfnA [Streptomyces sp. PKU-MA01144]TFE58517.1 tyrosine decarboxylase MfnA [Streptomyces sp. ICN441]
MRNAGAPASDVRRRIETELADDVPWNRVLNSICTEPHPLGVAMASAAAHTNLGDVRIFRGTKRIERKVVRLLLDLLDNPGGSGSLVSGGTEANLIAMLVARESARARGRLTGRPEVVVSSTVHFSFTKIFGLLGLTPVVVPVDDSLRLPAGEVARRIGEHTVAVIATAGSSEFGVVDAVDEIGPAVSGRDVHLHVDAATGGFIIPFARELGHDLPQFDFSVDGVDSITIDPHKYGLANVPAGAVLFRGAQDAGRFAVDSFFIDTPVHNTLLGTRPGAAAVSTYAVLEHLGRDGFRALTRTNFEVTRHLVAGLRAAGHELFAEPQLNIVVVRMPHAVRISQLLESWGWIVSTSKRFGETLRLVVTRHVTAEMVDEFLPVLERACKEVAAEAAPR